MEDTVHLNPPEQQKSFQWLVEEFLVRNRAEGEDCHLCRMGQGCEWDELKADMLEVAKDIELDPKTSNAWNNRKIRFNLYRYYTQVINGYLGRAVRIPLPFCIETKIKEMFPDDGTLGYVGYKNEADHVG